MSAGVMFTIEDVSRHSKRDDLYLIVHDKVYNLTDYAQKHPGGENLILDLAGQDATEAFEDIGHSEGARKDLEEHLVGELEVQTKMFSRTVLSEKEDVSLMPIIERHKTPFMLAMVILVYVLVTGVIRVI